uniref:Lipopolysaccharide biosynthesis protein n=1 Tax=Panagrellus redivivus TaxID=6233 RepID=A0A7E4VNE7_PANRE
MTLAPGLETFLKIMIPLWFSMPLGLAVSAMYALLGRDIYTRMPNFIISFLILSCQIIDLTALTVSIDCAVASLTKTQDPFLREKFHGYIMSICCIVISICIGLAFHFYTINFADILSIFSMVIHIVCFLVAFINGQVTLNEHFQQLK